jgi:glyoxylase-like metal-dependent hydrolase (beta-lactamase superfamily II)/rhodanese-related sulfurtransferase
VNVVPFVHEGLGNSSYLVAAAGGSAILIDPDRRTRRYLDEASVRGWRITAVIETHLHADFVSGAGEVAAAVGAALFVPARDGLRSPYRAVGPSERWTIDGLEIESIASPGHTPEHLSYVVRAGSQPAALFSGGSLMIGGAARTDLISPGMTDALTRAQYRTLRGAFSALPDETLLLPTHGGGSFCAAGGGSGLRAGVLGHERATNPALAFNNEDDFAAWFPTTFPAAPAYYFRMRAFNQNGPRLRREIADPPALAPRAFNDARREALVIDVRAYEDHAAAHIPGSVSIAFRDSFAVWLGWLAADAAPLLFVAGDESIEDVIDESLLVGYERFAGVLEGGMAAWTAARLPVARTELAVAGDAKRLLQQGAVALDVRERGERASGAVPASVHVPLGELPSRMSELPEGVPIVVYCGHGERAETAASLLEQAGREQVVNLNGGFGAWRDAGYPIGVAEATVPRPS